MSRDVAHSIMGSVFYLDPRYRDLKTVGKGSYGIVISALDTKSDKRVAIKKITPMAKQEADAKHVLREIRLMRYLGVHPNIISLEDLAVRELDDELYIVMELLDSDLHRIIQSSQALSDAHHRYFMYQLLRGVKFLHDNRIIHRDLKPGNLLVTKTCQLRITDFGLARERPLGRGPEPDDEVLDPMTAHVVTRWYRPPELMLCPDGLYTYAVDLWSVGCIFAELLGRQPLFPGADYISQLVLIFNVLGDPLPEEVAHIPSQEAHKFLKGEQVAGKPKVPLATIFPQASVHAVDLLERLLVFDPPKRIGVAEALDHPYFDPLRSSEGMREDPVVAMGLEFDFETQPMARLQLKQLILQEVESFRHEQRQKKRDRDLDRLTGRGGAQRERRATDPPGSSSRHHQSQSFSGQTTQGQASSLKKAQSVYSNTAQRSSARMEEPAAQDAAMASTVRAGKGAGSFGALNDQSGSAIPRQKSHMNSSHAGTPPPQSSGSSKLAGNSRTRVRSGGNMSAAVPELPISNVSSAAANNGVSRRQQRQGGSSGSSMTSVQGGGADSLSYSSAGSGSMEVSGGDRTNSGQNSGQKDESGARVRQLRRRSSKQENPDGIEDCMRRLQMQQPPPAPAAQQVQEGAPPPRQRYTTNSDPMQVSNPQQQQQPLPQRSSSSGSSRGERAAGVGSGLIRALSAGAVRALAPPPAAPRPPPVRRTSSSSSNIQDGPAPRR